MKRWLLLFALFLPKFSLAGNGTLHVITFDENGILQTQSKVTIIDATGKIITEFSDEYGSVYKTLPSGNYTIQLDNKERDVYIQENHLSEIILSSTGDIDTQMPSENNIEEVATTEVPDVLFQLKGRIVDLENNPIGGAVILVRGSSEEAMSDEQGFFSISVSQENIDLVVYKSQFIQRQFQLQFPREENLEVILTPSGFVMDDFVIQAPRIEGSTSTMLAERKEASSLNDVLGSEQMSRAGDSDAAAALKRVTGLTVIGGKYVYVRGLGERYSASLLNGSTLPSPEPERRVVPLDLFPTTLLESITIQKTFSPDKPAEFGGGIVSLQTREIPEEPTLRIDFSSSYTENSTYLSGSSGFQGSNDWSTYGNSERALPTNIQNASNESPLEERDMFSQRGYTAEELENLGESMPNHWQLDPQTVSPNWGVTIGGGNGWDIGKNRFGVLSAVLLKNGWDLNEYDKNYYLIGQGSQLEKSHTYRFEELSHESRLSGAIMTTFEGEFHTIKTATLLNRHSSLDTRTYAGYNRDVATDIKVTRINWKERALFFQQVQGDHVIIPDSDLSFNWSYTYSQAFRQEPDRREFRYDLEEATNTWYLSDRPEGNSILYSDLLDENHDRTIMLKKGIYLGNTERRSEIRIGGGMVDRDRGVDTRRFKYMHKGRLSLAPEVLQLEPQDIFVSDNIGSDGFQFEEVTRQTDNYSADQKIRSGFALIDGKIKKRVSLLTGARIEASEQNVQTFELFNPDQTPVTANLDNVDILPAFTGSIDLGNEERDELENQKIRFGYGRTVSRPDFRELSPATFNDVTGGRQVYGNPDLKRALIDNYDIRWEYYPKAGETFSIGMFYKDFQNPIESIVVVSAQHSVTYQNADSAKNTGLEMDFRKSFEFISPRLETFFVSGNASWIRSRVQLDENAGIQTSNERPLEGQSPYVYNLQLGYDHPEGLWGVTSLYNVFGPRITEVGALGAPDNYQLPIHRIDGVGYVRVGDFQIGLQGRNLLNSPSKTITGDKVVEEIYTGRTYSLRLRWQPL